MRALLQLPTEQPESPVRSKFLGTGVLFPRPLPPRPEPEGPGAARAQPLRLHHNAPPESRDQLYRLAPSSVKRLLNTHPIFSQGEQTRLLGRHRLDPTCQHTVNTRFRHKDVQPFIFSLSHQAPYLFIL